VQPFNSDLRQFHGPIFQKLKNICASSMTQACVKWVCKSGVGEWKEGEKGFGGAFLMLMSS
jgi:hypothetical protein